MDSVAEACRSPLFTVPEAAWVADTGIDVVKRDFDKHVVVPVEKGKRVLDRAYVSYLWAVRSFHNDLAVNLRRRILDTIRASIQDGHRRQINFDSFVLRLGDVLAEVDLRILKVQDARGIACSNPKIRGGEPVVVGTRIPIRMLADMARSGVEELELANEYSLSEDQIRSAILYDKLHPRRGRPPADATPDLIDLDDLDRGQVARLGMLATS